eukprot:scaffold1636_cov165-Ochromonas_danica.AAC.17
MDAAAFEQDLMTIDFSIRLLSSKPTADLSTVPKPRKSRNVPFRPPFRFVSTPEESAFVEALSLMGNEGVRIGLFPRLLPAWMSIIPS